MLAHDMAVHIPAQFVAVEAAFKSASKRMVGDQNVHFNLHITSRKHIKGWHMAGSVRQSHALSVA
eukprot:6171903-Pleurochrysis_carterae.AAC.1